MNYIIYEFFISFFLALIVTFSATPIVRKFAFKVGAIDTPKDNRRMHKKPIPRLGGLSIIAGFLVSVFFSIITAFFEDFGVLSLNSQFFNDFLALLGGSFIIVIVAYFDDIKPLSAKFKLVFQVLAAFIVVMSGTRIEVFTNPFSDIGLSQIPTIPSFILTMLWIIGITNAINFIDGLDGLAAGVASISSLSLFLVAAVTERWETALLAAALAGACLGFLPYNFNPAKIFMGDTGSTFLGFVLAVMSVQGTIKQYAAIAITVPLLVLGLPLFDTISSILRRLKRGQSPMKADRGHLHHRLVDMGLSHKQSVVVMYTASSALGLCAVVLADKGAISAIILILAIAVFVIGGAKYMTEINDVVEEDDDKDNLDEVDQAKKNSLIKNLETSSKDDTNIKKTDTKRIILNNSITFAKTTKKITKEL